MPLSTLPDAEVLFVQALLLRAPVTAIVSTRIGTRISTTPVYPLIRLTKVAERFTDEEGVELVTVQVECWADSASQASLLARTVVACRLDLRGTYAAGWLSLVEVSSGPIPVPDPISQRERWILDLDASVGSL